VHLNQSPTKSLKSAPADTTTQEQEPTEPVTDQAGDVQIDVYPNPTKGALEVTITGTESPTCEVTVVDANGKSVYANEHFGLSGAIDLSQQPQGVYIMRFEVDGEVSEWKVVRE
jgi:hypothetical protein